MRRAILTADFPLNGLTMKTGGNRRGIKPHSFNWRMLDSISPRTSQFTQKMVKLASVSALLACVPFVLGQQGVSVIAFFCASRLLPDRYFCFVIGVATVYVYSRRLIPEI